MAKESISKKDRFEILKRDHFTCRYCGKSSPDVVLEVDHIVPKADGGSNDPTNLVTACYSCNRGKGKRRLSEVKTGESAYDRAIELLEQERQIEELEMVQMRVNDRIETDLKWLQQFYNIDEKSAVSYRRFLRDTPASMVKKAMDIAAEKFGGYSRSNYVAGILKNWKNGVQAAA